MNDSFYWVPRALKNNDIWKGFNSRERHAFDVFLDKMMFKKTTQDDHGLLVEVLPLQLLTTYRDFARICNLSKPKEMEEFDETWCYRFFVKLKLLHFTKQEVKRKKTLITCTQSDVCEIRRMMDETRSETILKQSRNNLETQKKKYKKEKKDKKEKTNVFLSDSVEIGLSESLANHLRKINPHQKLPSNFQTWAKVFDLILRVDERKPDQVLSMINWLPTDNFWSGVIQSPASLRKNFDKIIFQMQNPRMVQNDQKRSHSSPTRTEEFYGKRFTEL